MRWTWKSASDGELASPGAIAYAERMLRPLLSLACLLLPLQAVSAQSVVFNLVPTSSVLIGSGSFNSIAFTPQGTGSDRTQWMGQVTVQFDNLSNPTSLQITAGVLTAQNSGTWQPAIGGGAGSAAANYGFNVALGIATGRIAIRDLVTSASMASPTSVSSGGAGTYFFGVSGINTLHADATGGSVDYNAGLFGNGTTPVSGGGDNMTIGAGQLTIAGSNLTINVPVDFTFNGTAGGFPTTFRIVGNLVGTAVIPEPSTYALLACGALALAGGRFARRGRGR